MTKRPSESKFGLLTGIATIYNAHKVSKLSKLQEIRNSNMSAMLRDSHNEVMGQSRLNFAGIEIILQNQVATLQNMNFIGNVITDLIEVQKNQITYQISKDLAQELLGNQKNLLLDIEEQCHEIISLSKDHPEYSLLLAESLNDICDTNGINAESFKSIDLSDLREVRSIIKTVKSTPSEIRKHPSWSDSKLDDLVKAYKFIAEYPKELESLQNKLQHTNNRISEIKSERDNYTRIQLDLKIANDKLKRIQKRIAMEEDFLSSYIKPITNNISKLEKELHVEKGIMTKVYIFGKQRSIPKKEFSFTEYDELLEKRASNITFFRTYTFLQDELEIARGEKKYINAKDEFFRAKTRAGVIEKEISDYNLKLKNARMKSEDTGKLYAEENGIKFSINKLESSLSSPPDVVDVNVWEELMANHINAIEELNSELTKSQNIVKELSP